ncbi:hypothetical protein [Methylobacter sp. S3L5C]|uniref:hypothetical protein n=1 Tax=Methylobacter sp. S3L5C TaxID=2839024 RepID=UPI001FAE2507|nr:hypothetical protein [Methylobacter sp. S3L5C]UOA08601.1 hypothetical protein KKZ03_20820 [Methylobacter sp. S3L5C]
MPRFLLMTIILLLAACTQPTEFDDGYQLGDLSMLTKREALVLFDNIEIYCSKNSDSVLRKQALLLLHVNYPLIPVNGICG